MNFYSVVIPVYNRPQEVEELLQSLALQTFQNFEILLIEDGSEVKCDEVAKAYSQRLDIHYHFKKNEGQGFARNYGFERAKGDYFIVFDSDCIIPKHYFAVVDQFLKEHQTDAFGGPDQAHPTFNSLQKAISYSMTSPFTTGGIRGREKRLGTFHPRSFNMGIAKEVFERTRGYRITRMGEDIEFSIRIQQEGFKSRLIPEAYVFHKRRGSITQFYKQLHFFGRARVNVNRFFPGELKMLHALPALFVLALLIGFTSFFWWEELFMFFGGGLSIYLIVIGIHATYIFGSLKVGILSIITSITQLVGYGMGLFQELLSPRGNQPFAQK